MIGEDIAGAPIVGHDKAQAHQISREDRECGSDR